MDDQQLIQQTIELFTRNGWQVISQSSAGIQFRKPRKTSAALIILGIIFLPFLIGIVFLVAAFTGKDRLEFVTIEQMREGKAGAIMVGQLPRTPIR